MTITTHTIWLGGEPDVMVALVRDVQDFFRRHGSQEVTFHRLHTGPHVGNYLLVHRYADWGAYGAAQQGWAEDAWYREHGLRVRKVARLGERALLVGLDLGLPDPPSAPGGPGPVVDLLVRYVGGPEPEMVGAVQEIHAFFLRHGIQRVRFHRYHFGPYIGEYLLELRYPSWEAFGRAQSAWSQDGWYREHGARVQRMTRTGERTFAVTLPL